MASILREQCHRFQTSFKIAQWKYLNIIMYNIISILFFFMIGESGIRRADVVNWYLKEKESEIDTTAELEEHTFLIGKIIDRLVKNVSLE